MAQEFKLWTHCTVLYFAQTAVHNDEFTVLLTVKLRKSRVLVVACSGKVNDPEFLDPNLLRCP